MDPARVAKVNFNTPSALIEPLAFIGIAFLAGKTRLIKHFPDSNSLGLVYSSTISGLFCYIGDKYRDGEDHSFLFKISLAAASKLPALFAVKVLSTKGKLSFASSLKLVGLESLVILSKEAYLMEEAVDQFRSLIRSRDFFIRLNTKLSEENDTFKRHVRALEHQIERTRPELLRLRNLEQRVLEKARELRAQQNPSEDSNIPPLDLLLGAPPESEARGDFMRTLERVRQMPDRPPMPPIGPPPTRPYRGPMNIGDFRPNHFGQDQDPS